RLVDGLWGSEPPASPGNALATLAKRLRASLGETSAVQARAPGYVLLVDPGDVDASEFARLAAAGRRMLGAGDPAEPGRLLEAGDAAVTLDRLEAALRLWRGPALADVQGAPFAAAATALLEEQRLAAVEDRALAQLALGRAAEAVPVLLREQ